MPTQGQRDAIEWSYTGRIREGNLSFSLSMKEGRGDIYFPSRESTTTTTTGTKERAEGDGEQEGGKKRLCGEYALLLLMPPRPCPRPHPRNLPSSLLFADGQEAAAQPRERRGALCVSENVALIGGSVAVMRYQPPANKRINVKRWRRWMRRRKKLARG